MEHAQPVLVKRFTAHQDGETVNLAHTSVFTFGVLLLGNLLELLAYAFFIRRFEVVNADRIKEIALAVKFPLSLVLVEVLLQLGNESVITLHFLLPGFQFPNGFVTGLVERLAFTLQCCNLLLQLRLIQQVCIA